MDNKELKVGSKVYIKRNPSNDTGSFKEVEGQYYYITYMDNSAQYNHCVYNTPIRGEGDYIGWFSKEELTLVEEESKVVVINPTKTECVSSPTEVGIGKALWNIEQKDNEFYQELKKLILYLDSTYTDKYEGEDGKNYSKNKLLSKEGKAANIFTALKYIQRYDTVGYSKSENPVDLLKSMHYLLFENLRKTKHGDNL
jgi:hypothetical protein